MESTFNKSVKIMYELPWATHRYLIEPLSGVPHLHRILARRFLSFIKMIRNSGKIAIVQLLDTVQSDVRLTTGSNLRTILLESELTAGNIDVEYNPIPASETYRINFIKEIVEVKHGEVEVPGFSQEELDHIKEYLCTH